MRSRLLLIIMVCLLAPNAALAGDCWELLTRASAWTDKWQAGAKEAGDVVAVQPAGSEWGPQERDPARYTLIVAYEVSVNGLDWITPEGAEPVAASFSGGYSVIAFEPVYAPWLRLVIRNQGSDLVVSTVRLAYR